MIPQFLHFPQHGPFYAQVGWPLVHPLRQKQGSQAAGSRAGVAAPEQRHSQGHSQGYPQGHSHIPASHGTHRSPRQVLTVTLERSQPRTTPW